MNCSDFNLSNVPYLGYQSFLSSTNVISRENSSEKSDRFCSVGAGLKNTKFTKLGCAVKQDFASTYVVALLGKLVCF